MASRRGLSKRGIARITITVAIVAVLVVAGFAAYYYFIPTPVKPPVDAIVVGYPASLTGVYESLGKQALNGLQLWQEQVNGNGGIFLKDYGTKLPVKIVFADDRSDKDTSVRLTEKLITEDKAQFMFAPYSSGLTFASAPITEKYKILNLAWGASSNDIWEQGFKYVVGIFTPATLYHASALDLLKQRLPDAKVALITEEELFSVTADKGAAEKAAQLGFQVVYRDRYPQNPRDLSTIILKLKEIQPDAVFVSGHLKDNVLFIKQLAEFKVKPKLVSVISGGPAASFWKDTAGAAAYVLAPSQWEPVTIDASKIANWYGEKISPKGWTDRFMQKYSYEPDYRAASAYGAALILQAALEKAGNLDTEKVREALLSLDVTTIFGRYKVDPQTFNQFGHEMLLVQWVNGKKVVVGPKEFAEADVVFPIP